MESAQAAAITTETFTAGANGWQGTFEFEGAWSFTGGCAKVAFANTGLLPIPSKATLSNLPYATSGSFTGDYEAAGINTLGFSFYVDQEPPSSVDIFWGSTNNIYFRIFDTNSTRFATQTWHTLSASLASPEYGKWNVLTGSLTNFQAALQEVQFIAIRIARSGVLAQQFRIDNLFLGRQPTGANTAITGEDGLLTWNSLLPNNSYQLESSTNLAAPVWIPVDSFIATGTLHHVAVPVSDETGYFRLRMP